MTTITVTKENIWDVIKDLRLRDFGVIISTVGYHQYKVELIYWPIHGLKLGPQVAGSPEKAMEMALQFALNLVELENLIADTPTDFE